MAMRLIHKSERGMGNEDWYYLCRDAETGRAFVLHEWSHRAGDGYSEGSAKLTLHEFLANGGTKQDKLLEMVGTLVPEDRADA